VTDAGRAACPRCGALISSDDAAGLCPRRIVADDNSAEGTNGSSSMPSKYTCQTLAQAAEVRPDLTQ
jgi:hypothetical protein